MLLKVVSLVAQVCSSAQSRWKRAGQPEHEVSDADLSAALKALASARPPAPSTASQSASRRLLLSSLSQPEGGMSVNRVFWKKAMPFTIAGAIFVVAAAGAAAASGNGSPLNNVLGSVGLSQSSDNHGSHVSDAVHQAIATATPGPGFGQAVSEAACTAAHDRTTLPSGAQNAPGQQNAASDCGTPTPEAAVITGPSPSPSPSPSASASASAPTVATATASATPNHGESVSSAVHDAIASTTPGPERGQAVSEAACTAAHDRTTLPQGAQDAPGQQGKTPKDCTQLGNQSAATPSATAGASTSTDTSSSDSSSGGSEHGAGNSGSNNPSLGNSGNNGSSNSGLGHTGNDNQGNGGSGNSGNGNSASGNHGNGNGGGNNH